MQEDKTNFFIHKEEKFDYEPPINLLPQRIDQKLSLDEIFQVKQFSTNQMNNLVFPDVKNSFTIDLEVFFYRDISQSNSTGKNNEVDDCIIDEQSNPNSSLFSSSKSFKELRNGKKQSPKPLSVNNKRLQSLAYKNALQFFSWLIYGFFKQKPFFLTTEQEKLVEQLKKSPTINGFDKLFKTNGNIKIGLTQFFYSHKVWSLILCSRVRHHRYKLIIKKILNMMRKAFIQQQFQGLSSLKSFDQKRRIQKY